MLAQLIPQDGGQPITIDRDLTLVGRNRHICDLHLNHISVSKIHCLIVKTDGLLFIRDLGSSNGTRVNGQRVSRGALLPGDQLAFANLKYKVYLGPDKPIRSDQTEVIPVVQNLIKKKRPADASGASHSMRKPPMKAKPVLAESDSDVRIVRDRSEDDLEI
ncbi:MAG: garA 2, partial [Planctomycetaceae bacterium]|nr:garA 2 [Planctomycetaceae bacterium]